MAETHELNLKFFIWSKIFETFNLAIRLSVLVAAMFFTKEALIELAGQDTHADISLVLKYFTSPDSDYGLPIITSSVFFTWALVERQFRKTKTEQMGVYIRELERQIDPDRASSGLTPSGRTHPDDQRL